MDFKTSHSKDVSLPISIYRIKVITVKIPARFLLIKMNILKCI